MNKQTTIFDLNFNNPNKRPCEYSFQRYIGQKVRISVTEGKLEGKIKGIEPYYTIISVKGREYAGTPYNTYPKEETA